MSQNELGKKVGTSGDIIGRYERDEVKPSIEVANKIAGVLEVSLDYLVGNTDLLLDASLIRKIQKIQKLPDEDRKHLLYLMDNVLQNLKAREAFAS